MSRGFAQVREFVQDSFLARRRFSVACGAFLLYLLLVILMTWPLVTRLTTHLPGTGGDLWVHWWNLHWLKQAVQEGASPFYTDLLFHPLGLNLAYHNFAWLHALAWVPLQVLTGGAAAYGIVFILTFALSGLGMYLWVLELTESEASAFIAGLVYAFWPYTHSHFNHTNMMAVQWLPLVLLGFRRVIRKGRVRDALLAAAFLALTGLARWHHLIFGGIIFALFLFQSLLTERERWSWRTVGLLALAGVLAGLVLLPLAVPILNTLLLGDHPEDILVQERREGQTDLLAYLVPSRKHPLWGGGVFPLYDLFDVNEDHIAYLGYVAVGLALCGLVRRWKTARFWLLCAAVILSIALGANLRIAGSVYPAVPMPYRVVEKLFFIRLMRHSDRFNIVMGLPVAVMAGWGVQALLAGMRPRRVVWAVVGLSALILFDYAMVPYTTVEPYVPVWYERLAAEDGDFAILPIPMGAGNSKDHMLYQMTHGKPTVTGETARPPREAFAFIESSALLRGMQETREFDPALVDISRQLEVFSEAGVRYMVLHPRMSFVEGRVERWQDWLTFAPFYEDNDVIVYHTTPEYGRDFGLQAEVGDGIGLITATLSTQVLAQDGLLEIDLRWGTRAAPTKDWSARISLIPTSGEMAQSVHVEPCPGWPTGEWGANVVARGKAVLQVDPFIDGGSYAVMLDLIDPDSGDVAAGAVELGQVEVQAVERTFEVPEMSVPVGVIFGDDLRLLGYDLDPSGNDLLLTLHWQALQRMDVSYKMFAHLVDAQSGQLVAQADVVPRNWGYPTHWWEVEEVVSDLLDLPLAEVPTGTYRLMVGVYDPQTGNRISIQNGEERVESDALFLQELTVP